MESLIRVSNEHSIESREMFFRQVSFLEHDL